MAESGGGIADSRWRYLPLGPAAALPAQLDQLYRATLTALWSRFATRQTRVTFRSAEFLQGEAERALRFKLTIAVPYTVRF